MFAAFPPTVSIIVPVYNGGAPFRSCLTRLIKADPPPSEIIIVADGDTDGSQCLAESLGLRVIKLPTPGGPARARNQGSRIACGDVLLFIDSDVVVPPDIVGRVAKFFEDHPRQTALIGSYDDEPGEKNFFSQYKNLSHHYVHQTAREDASTFWGACGAIRREVFLALEGFDENYRDPSIEDIELGYRLRQSGYHIRLLKELQVKHLKHWSALSLLKSDILHRAIPWTELSFRHRRLPNDLNIRTSSRISALLVCALVAAIFGAWWNSRFLWGLAPLMLSLWLLNAQFYNFLYRKRRLWFTLRAVSWHWFYYLYSTAAFAIGVLRYFAKRATSRPTRATKAVLPLERS
jgi:GT2 family glycosyltransferase